LDSRAVSPADASDIQYYFENNATEADNSVVVESEASVQDSPQTAQPVALNTQENILQASLAETTQGFTQEIVETSQSPEESELEASSSINKRKRNSEEDSDTDSPANKKHHNDSSSLLDEYADLSQEMMDITE